MDHSRGDTPVRYIKSAAGTGQPSSASTCVDSAARQSSLKCVDGDNVIIISDDADDVDSHLASWRCTNCTTVNPASVAQCISCLTLQTPDSLPMEDAKNGEEKLPGAEGGREVLEIDVDRDDEVWVCRRCTLKNVPKSARCEVCEAPRRSFNFHNHMMDSITGRRQPPVDGKVDVLGTGASHGVDKSDNVAGECATQSEDWVVWTCSNCTYNNNPSWANICDVCETVKQAYSSQQKQAVIGKAVSVATACRSKEKVATSWQCPVCSKTNANSVRDCTNCGALRTEAGSDSAEDSWTCAKCTLRNSSMAHVCAACLSKRNTVLPQIDDSDTKWPCQQCTCLNRSSNNFCQACGRQKQSSSNSSSNHQVPGSSKPNVMRQSSVCVREQQDREEMAARDQWNAIVNFCKVVSYLDYYISEASACACC